MAVELDACLCGRESPVNLNGRLIAFVLPSEGLMFKRLQGGDTAVKALAYQDREFDFGHVEPTAVLGSKVEPQLLLEFMGALCGEMLIECAIAMGVQIILNDLNHGRSGIIGRGEPVPELGVIGFGAPRPHLQIAFAAVQIIGEEQRARATAFVFIIFFAWAVWPQRQRRHGFTQQLTGQFIKADTGLRWITRLFVHIQNVFHTGNVVASGF